MLLRERATSEMGLLLEAPTVEAPDWCKYHDSNGDEYPSTAGEYAALQKTYSTALRCGTEKLSTVEELDAWLYAPIEIVELEEAA